MGQFSFYNKTFIVDGNLTTPKKRPRTHVGRPCLMEGRRGAALSYPLKKNLCAIHHERTQGAAVATTHNETEVLKKKENLSRRYRVLWRKKQPERRGRKGSKPKEVHITVKQLKRRKGVLLATPSLKKMGKISMKPVSQTSCAISGTKEGVSQER